MEKVIPLYLTLAVHYLTYEQARAEKTADGCVELRKHEDGTYSAFHLSPKPPQKGQVPWKR